ncbi:MAG: helix-turn-helix domain-containing protein [Spirochaetaceae bacterium]|jgi:two-component system response regulator YesN|nr:helix-turn-helix domain-containing protein [Spirochaetaceae bacterium]
MYRVLIVDDEEPVLDSYEFMLKSAEGFVLAGKARSGYEALRLIHETEPDLVFMDINIPGLDGLAVIADVHKKFPRMEFVLSTAYERFDLAKRAIPLGVFAYLVKPVSKKTFFSTLNEVREALVKRPPPEEEREDSEELFFKKILWQEMSEETWENWRERLALPSDRGMVFMLEFGEDTEKWGEKIAEALSYKYHCRYNALLNRGLFLVSGNADRETLKARLDAVLKASLPAALKRFRGVGGLYRGPELYRSCNEALGELEEERQETGLREEERQWERLRIIQLRRKIGAVPPEEVRKLFTVFWEELFRTCDFTLAKVKMVPVFMFLMDDLTGCYRDNTAAEPAFALPEEIMALPDQAAWEAWAAGAFEKLLLQASLRRSNTFPVPLAKAIEYIHAHYAEGIQLGDAADAAQVSPAYLSRLFSEHGKTTFIDYITELRIENAEKLLRESKMNIKEVAFAAGYQDPNYFSKIFRKITGFSPLAYAEEVKRGGGGGGNP